MLIFIIVFLVVLSISVWGWKTDNFNPWSQLAATVGPALAFLMIIGTTIPVWNESIESFDTTSTKLGSEIIIQSPGLPTQIVTDLKFVDVPLVIIKKTHTNLYGLAETETPTYTVEIKKIEK